MRISVLLIALVLPFSLFAGETEVQINESLTGKLVVPEGPHNRAVLLLHGWHGGADEVGNYYVNLASILAERGIASLRFSFSGEGREENYVSTVTYESRTGEASAAYRYLRGRYPDAAIGVNGFSLGGLTAIAIAADNPDWFASMVLWSAASNMNMADDPYAKDAWREAIETGTGSYQSWTELTLTREFIVGFSGVEVTPRLADYPGALLTIRGTEDFLPSQDQHWLQLAPTKDKSFLLIGGADHIFNVLEEPQPHYSSQVLKATVDWFDRTLKR